MPQSTNEEVDREDLEEGFTTGTCATATAKAALTAILTGNSVENVTVDLPIDRRLELTVRECGRDESSATYAITKDAGDDPDVTDGAVIRSTVELIEGNGVQLEAGEGVGVVTRPGLPVEQGEPAINPTPRTMIRRVVENLRKQYTVEGGVRVTVSVEDGEALADNTLNPRLGIEGGISILGTTGIVEPYSNASYVASVEQGMDVARANGLDRLVLTTGGRTEDYAQNQHDLPEYGFVQFAGFLREALEYLVEHPVSRLDIHMMPGKFSKLMQGHVELHSSDSRVDADELREDIKEILDPSREVIREIRELETANQILSYFDRDQVRTCMETWIPRALSVLRSHFGDRLNVDELLLHVMTLQGDPLGSDRWCPGS